MSHPSRNRAPIKWLWECLFAAGLGLLLLGVGVWQRTAAMGNLSSNWSGLANLMGLRLGSTPLGAEVLQFALAQLALHIGFGLAAWLLARLTLRAFDIPRQHRWKWIGGWFLGLTAWLLIANATLFPWSSSGVPSTLIGKPLLADARVFELFSFALVAAVALVLFMNARAVPLLRQTGKRTVIYGSLVLLVVVVAVSLSGSRETEPTTDTKPNIILIGIDSLRPDVVGAGETPGLTPNVDAFLRDGAQLFTDAITPLARTFPAWTSILSGRNPTATGARENLVAFETLGKFDTISKIAQRNGYRTIFATDEVRFSNIDTSFGFDQAITPTVGAADFLLGKFNDLPLPNLVANSRLGRWLFPATYSNRAAAVTYRPDTFVNWIDSAVEPRGPTLLAVHFTLPHVPYNWSAPGDAVFGRVSDNAYQYSNAVIAADRQFGQLVRILERKGLLRNALVVVLSDHGEALGLPASDALLRGAVARDMLDGQRISLWGHGSSVLSPHQFAVVLAMRGFGSVDLPPVFHEHDAPVSLIDVAPTIADLLGLAHEQGFEGTSLRPVMAGDRSAIEALERRPRFTETGFRTPRIENGDYDERSVMGEVAVFFRMNPVNARLEVRPDLMPVLLADKERAVMNRDWMLVSIPSRTDKRNQKYVLVSRRGEPPRRLEAAPAPGDAQAFALWTAMHEHYGGELLPPAPRAAIVATTTNKGS
jgi:arylsulfatase A-like enzyme